jgi:hypothetical protein
VNFAGGFIPATLASAPPVDVGWLTQPKATVIAAAIAVIAAAIAFAGVVLNVRSSQRQYVDKQMAENREQRRTEIIDSFVDCMSALASARELVHKLIRLRAAQIDEERRASGNVADSDEVKELIRHGGFDADHTRVRLASMKLELLGFGAISAAVQKADDDVWEFWDLLTVSSWRDNFSRQTIDLRASEAHQRDIVESFRAIVARLDSKASMNVDPEV